MHLSSIRLDSPVELGVIAALAVLAVIAVPWFWDRWRKRKQLGRSATVLTAVVLVVVSLAMTGNLIGGFFPTVGALVGTGAYSSDGTDAEGGDNGADLDQLRDAGAMHAKAGKGLHDGAVAAPGGAVRGRRVRGPGRRPAGSGRAGIRAVRAVPVRCGGRRHA